MLGRDGNDELSTLLIIAPVGVYIARVQTGLDHVIASTCSPTKTKVRVLLVADSNWTRLDQSYEIEFVEPTRNYLMKT